MSTKREIAIIGATLDLGQGRRGVDMGPSAIRYAGLEERLVGLGYAVRDEGNVETAVAEATAVRDERARFLPEIHDTCELIAARVAEVTSRGALPLVLGGDHSVALGTLGGLASVHGPGRRALDRRALGHQHAGDEPERERPRDGSCRRARSGRARVRERRLAAAGSRSEAGGARRARGCWTTESGGCCATPACGSSR